MSTASSTLSKSSVIMENELLVCGDIFTILLLCFSICVSVLANTKTAMVTVLSVPGDWQVPCCSLSEPKDLKEVQSTI